MSAVGPIPLSGCGPRWPNHRRARHQSALIVSAWWVAFPVDVDTEPALRPPSGPALDTRQVVEIGVERRQEHSGLCDGGGSERINKAEGWMVAP